MVRQIKQEIELSNKIEKRIQKMLERRYGGNIKNTKKDKYCYYDFINEEEKIIFEIKNMSPWKYHMEEVCMFLDKLEKYWNDHHKKGYKFLLITHIDQRLYEYNFTNMTEEKIRQQHYIQDNYRRGGTDHKERNGSLIRIKKDECKRLKTKLTYNDKLQKELIERMKIKYDNINSYEEYLDNYNSLKLSYEYRMNEMKLLSGECLF